MFLNIPGNWECDIARIQLRDNFPVEYENIINTSRNICQQQESINTSAQIKNNLNKVSLNIKIFQMK